MLDIMWAIALLATANLACLAVGFVVGRLGERKAIAQWLWNRRADYLTWQDVSAVEHGVHRKREKVLT